MTRWSFAASATVIVFGSIVWLASAWLCYLNWQRRGGSAKIAALELLRLVVITLLGFTLLRPELVQLLLLDNLAARPASSGVLDKCPP